MCKVLAFLSLLVLILEQGVWAKDYRYFSLQLPSSWREVQGEVLWQQGIHHVIFERQDGKAGVEIFSSTFPALGANAHPIQERIALTLVLAAIEQQAKIKFEDKRFDNDTQSMEVTANLQGRKIDGRLFVRKGVMYGVAYVGLTKAEVLDFLQTFQATGE